MLTDNEYYFRPMDAKPENQPRRPPGRYETLRNAVEVAPLRPLRIPTDRLMAGRREIVLQHGAEEYRLRVTSLGKLILTK